MKKIVAIIILVFVFCSVILGAGTLGYAETLSLDDTGVLDDLSWAVIGGVTFSPDNYTYSSEKMPQVLSFAEYAFSFDTRAAADYALYVYVYNPSGRSILATRNAISVATVYDGEKPVDYQKFDMQFLSVSDGMYARLFYKFKLIGSDKIYSRVSQNTTIRRYDVGEIELNFGGFTSESYAVGNYYEYSGFAQGYGADMYYESTLSCRCDAIETLQLEVNSTYYRYNNGVNTQSNLNSVYFGVPTQTLKKYGKLQEIKANWFETRTDVMCVFNNFALYDYLFSYTGTTNKTANLPNDYHRLLGDPHSELATGDGYTLSNYQWGYSDSAKGYTDNVRYNLPWVFYSSNSDEYISTSDVLTYAQSYTQKYGGEKLIDKYSKQLFVTEVDNGRQYGWQGDDGNGIVIDADSLFDINGFTTGSKFFDWWSHLIYKDLNFDKLKNISPIYVVGDVDLIGSDETIANRLLIDVHEVSDFKNVYKQNNLEGKQTVLFRFALTEYNAYNLYAVKTTANPFDNPATVVDVDVGYWCQQTCFLDFDIIWLKFVKENQETVIPVVSSPIDVFSGLTPPLDNDGLNLLAVLLALLVVVLLVVFIYKLFTVRKR